MEEAASIELDEHGRKIYRPDGLKLRAFLRDTSHVSIIRGPIGSGTSSACCMKIFKLATEQRPNPMDGVRRSRWVVVRNCFDDETEILTESGWKLFRDLGEVERVAQLRDGKLEFVEPTYRYQAPYVGEMLGFENEGVDFRVTPDHRMYVSKRETRRRIWSDYRFEHCRDIYGNSDFRVKRDAEWEGVDPGCDEDFFEWLGFWFAEGMAGVYPCADGFTRHQCVVVQKKPEALDYVRRLCAATGFSFTEQVRADGLHVFRMAVDPRSKPLIGELAQVGKSTTKAVPAWMKNAPRGHLRRFIAGYLAGDGHVGEATVAYTSSARLADDLQEMALRAGMVANVHSRDRRGVALAIGGVETRASAVEWSVTFVGEGKHRPRLQRQGYAGRYRGWYRERYAGTVYCVEVPTHVVYVRRRGKAFWCSQTFPELKGTTVKTWLDWFPEEQYGRFYWDRPFRHLLRIADVEAEVWFLALDNPDDVRKLRSLELTGGWVNELEFTIRDIFDEIESRTGRYPAVKDGGCSWDGVIADMNAPNEDHWLPLLMGEVPLPDSMTEEERVYFQRPASWAYFVQPAAMLEEKAPDGSVTGYRVNPEAENLRWLKPGYYEEKVAGKTKPWIDSRIMNRITIYVEGLPVWKNFSLERHVANEALRPVPGWRVGVGLDFGRNPAAIFGQMVNSRAAVQFELVGANEGATEFAPKVRRFIAEHYPDFDLNQFDFWGDPKGQDKTQTDEQTAYDVFAAHGMVVRPAPVKQNHIQTRLDAVDHLLTTMLSGRPRMTLSPSCRVLKVAMAGGYHFARVKGTARHKEEPEKDRYSNPADALQYWALGMGEGRVMIGRSAHGRAEPVSTRTKKSRRRVAA